MRKRTIYFIAILIILGAFGCIKDSNVNVPMEENMEDVPYLDNQVLLDEGNFREIRNPIIYEDKVIVMIDNSEENVGWINCYDKNTLELLWRWQDALDTYGVGAKGFSTRNHIYDGILCVAQANLSYGIDINTGQTIWHNRDVAGNGIIAGHKERIVDATYNIWNEDYSYRLANIYTGEWDTIYTIERNDQYLIGGGNPFLFEWNNIDYVGFRSTKWASNPHYEESWLHLYNINEKQIEWTTDTIPKVSNTAVLPRKPKFHDGQITLASHGIYSFNVEDGSLEWFKYFNNHFIGLTSPEVGQGNIYGNNQSGFMVALDVHTGEEKFNTITGGGAGHVVYADEKVYISGAVANDGKGYLMRLDANTGEKLNEVLPPYRETSGENDQWIFGREIAVDSETNKVYVTDHRYLLVYDFE